MPYQWLIVKNKTVIGPKTTEEQKVLFIPPRAGVYRCVLNVSSWPASAESEVAARAEVFAKRVVLVAIAENPALEVRASGSSSHLLLNHSYNFSFFLFFYRVIQRNVMALFK